jgi:pimeloyl-ACP methyl ester carboxylesterase/lysophospholipase L1-like esterase
MKALFLLLFPLLLHAAEPRVLFLGDSITFDGRWTTGVESALRGTAEFDKAEMVNVGLPSETASGLSEDGHAGGKFPRPCVHERLARVLEGFKPTLVFACYGMNDGVMQPPDPVRMDAYRKGMTKLKEDVEKAGARIIFITPPLYQADRPSVEPKHYDKVLDGFAEWLVSKKRDGWEVVDIRPSLRESVAKAKAANPGFVFAGDGVHPGDEGHRFMARAACAGLWPILKLAGEPMFAEGKAFATLKEAQDLLKLAWLTETKHLRPGIQAGQKVEVAKEKAAKLLESWRSAVAVKTSVWNDHERLDFDHEGRPALLVLPKSAAPGKPWIWRTEFFGHEPQADIALLKKGFHVAYLDMQNLYGAPVALEAMDRFHAHLTEAHGLSSKVVLEGFSRGGLYAFNWGARRPEFTAGIYVDAPVCDFKSWPGGKGKGPGSAGDWQRLLKAYGFKNEEEAQAWKLNPVDNLEPLAKAEVPVFAVIGAADEVVPVEENIDLLEKRLKGLGGSIEVIRKPGGKHHPHSLKDPTPIVDFAIKAAAR